MPNSQLEISNVELQMQQVIRRSRFGVPHSASLAMRSREPKKKSRLEIYLSFLIALTIASKSGHSPD